MQTHKESPAATNDGAPGMFDHATKLISSEDTVAAENAQVTVCESCQGLFVPRSGSGGKPQRFCSEKCRRSFHAGASPTPSPTPKAGVGDSEVGHIGAQPKKPTLALACGNVVAPSTDPDEDFPPGYPFDPPQPCGEEFDWSDRDSIVLQEQRRTAIYWNLNGDLVIRQEKDWNDNDDCFIVISSGNLQAFIDRLCDMAGIPSFGGPEPKPLQRR